MFSYKSPSQPFFSWCCFGISDIASANCVCMFVNCHWMNMQCYSALIWQKEASDKSEISRKRAKCVCHLHWRQWNIRMSYLTYLLVGWVFLHEIWPGRRAHYVNYENINNSNLEGMSLASFCQSRAVLWTCCQLMGRDIPLSFVPNTLADWWLTDDVISRIWVWKVFLGGGA